MSREVLRRLARRELDPKETAEALRHVGACNTCSRAAMDDLQPEIDALRTAIDEDDGPWHPDESELAAYADGVAGPAEREIVESHLDDCPLCREDVAGLAPLARPRPHRRTWRVAVTVTAAAAIAVILILQRSDDRPPPPSPAVAATNDTGSTITATTTTVATTPREPPPKYANAEWDRLVRTALDTKTLPFPRDLRLTPDVLRGSAGDPAAAVSPAGVALDEARPRFAWPARAGATYVVSVFAGEEQVAQSGPLTVPRWTPPRPLPRGRTYVWQVQATAADGAREIIPAPPAPPAVFRIVSRRDRDELESARRLHPDDHLLHAVLAARAGLRDRALEALQRSGADDRARPLRERYLD